MIKVKGVITVQLAATSLLMIIFISSIIDYTRIRMAEIECQNAMSLALLSIASEYDNQLFDEYGIYGLNEQKLSQDLKVVLNNYFEQNTQVPQLTNLEKVVKHNQWYVDPIDYHVTNIQAQLEKIASSENALNYIEYQILEYMKYRGPMLLFEKLLNQIKGINQLLPMAVLTEERKNIDQQLDNIQSDYFELTRLIDGIQLGQKAGNYHLKEPFLKQLMRVSNTYNPKLEGEGIAEQIANRQIIPERVYANLTASLDKLTEIGNDYCLAYEKDRVLNAYLDKLDAIRGVIENQINQKAPMDYEALVSQLTTIKTFEDEFNQSRNDIAYEMASNIESIRYFNTFTSGEVDKLYRLFNGETTNLITINEEILQKVEAIQKSSQQVIENTKVYTEKVNSSDEVSDEMKTGLVSDLTSIQTQLSAQENGCQIATKNNLKAINEIAKSNQLILPEAARLINSIQQIREGLCFEALTMADPDNAKVILGFKAELSDRLQSSNLSISVNELVGIEHTNIMEKVWQEAFQKMVTIKEPNLKYTFQKDFTAFCNQVKEFQNNIYLDYKLSSPQKVENPSDSVSESVKTGELALTSEVIINKEIIDDLVFETPEVEFLGLIKDLATFKSINLSELLKKALSFSFDFSVEGINQLIINEYVMGEFSFFESENSEESQRLNLGGEPISEHLLSNEVEYVIGGKSNDQENLDYIKTKLMYIRIPLNLFHVIADAQKRTMCLSIGQGLMGWCSFGIGGNLVAYLLMIAWSVAESFIDVELLLSGKRVPLLKSKSSWITSIEGIGKMGSDKLIELVESYSFAAIDKVGETVKGKSQEILSSVSSEISGVVEEQLNALCEQTIAEMDRVSNQIDLQINQAIDKSINTIMKGEMLDKMSIKVGNPVIEEAIYELAIRGTTLSLAELAEAKMSLINHFKVEIDAMKTETMNALQDVLNDTLDQLQEAIDDSVDSYSDKAKAMVHQKVTKVCEDAGQKLDDKISKMTLNNFPDKETITSSKQEKTGLVISLSYEDYLRLMLISVKKEDKIPRIASLINFNLHHKDDTVNLAHFGYSIKAHADISIDYLLIQGKWLPAKQYTMFEKGIELHIDKQFVY